MPKKVLIFSVVYYPQFVGGAEVAVKEITDRLSTSDYEFHLIALRLNKDLPKEERFGNVFIHRIGFAGEMKERADSLRFPLHYAKYFYPFLAAWKGWRLSRKHNFTFTWGLMANYSGFGALFFKLLKPRIPFMLNLQEGDPPEYIEKTAFRVGTGKVRVPVHWFMRPVFRMIFKRADIITALSNYLADWGKKNGFKGKPIVVPNGVDTKNFDIEILKSERLKIREELGIKEDDVALVTTSRLVVKNGVGDVVSSLSKLPENIKFVILGEGYLKEELVALASREKVSDRVIWVGFVPHEEMPKYLKACDIFIRPSLSEGFGNSFIEAMAARLPVIATPVGGIVDFLFDPSNTSGQAATGYFCKPENPESIAEVVKEIVVDPQKQQIIETAYKMAKEKYDWDLVASQMNSVFKNIS